MYPIEAVEGDDGEYNIRGLKLPLKELAACEEEQLSTALGYVCHLVFMISKYLQVTVCICRHVSAARAAARAAARRVF